MKKSTASNHNVNLRCKGVVATELRLLALDSVLHISNKEQSQESFKQYTLNARVGYEFRKLNLLFWLQKHFENGIVLR